MQLKDIHPLINTQPGIHIFHERTAHGREEANDHGDPRGNITGGGGDAYQSGNRTFTGSDDAEASLVFDIVDDNPADYTGGGRSVGVENYKHGPNGYAERGTAVETEPAKPDEHRAEEDKRDVVGFFVGGGSGFASVLALAENQGVGERAAAGGDVYGTTTGEVERGELNQFLVG